MLARARRHPIACFVAITYLVSWTAWLTLAARGQLVGADISVVYLVGLLGPLIGAIATTAITNGRAGLRDLFARMVRVRVGLRWWGVALAIPIGVAAATHVVMVTYSMFLLAPVDLASWPELGQFTGFPVTNALVMLLLLTLVNGYGEETGWRGFLLPALQRRWSPLTASIIIFGFWALWHAPAFLVNENYRMIPTAMLPMFFIGLACGSLMLTWLYNRGSQSIALVAVWHGAYNWLSGTVGARGPIAAVESTVVMLIAAALLVRELRASGRERRGRPATHVMAPS